MGGSGYEINAHLGHVAVDIATQHVVDHVNVKHHCFTEKCNVILDGHVRLSGFKIIYQELILP